LFVGFAPRDNPEIVVCVIVQGGRSGGGVAAPIAGKIFQKYFDKKYGRPQGPEKITGPLQVASHAAELPPSAPPQGQPGIRQ